MADVERVWLAKCTTPVERAYPSEFRSINPGASRAR